MHLEDQYNTYLDKIWLDKRYYAEKNKQIDVVVVLDFGLLIEPDM